MIEIGGIGAAGRITAQVLRMVDGELVPSGPEHTQDNIVTAAGLQALTPRKENILSFTALSNVINLGTGTRTEQESVNTLANYITRGTGKLTTVSTVDFDDFEGSGEDLRVRTYRVQHQFAPTGTDRNYTEIGLGPDGDAGDLHTYAVFRDSQGDPAAITVRGDEYFNITYTYQVQAFRLRGFRTSDASSLANSVYALAPKGGRGLPIGPYPVTGDGVQAGTEAWVFTVPAGTISIRDYAGVSYTLDSAYDAAALADLLPNIRGYIDSSSDSTSTTHDVLGSGSPYSSTAKDSVMHNINTQLDSAGLALSRRNISTSSTGKQTIPPGGISSTETAYVYMWGSSRRGSIVMLTKPIVVGPDMEFTIDESVGLAWTVKPAVNMTWIDPED